MFAKNNFFNSQEHQLSILERLTQDNQNAENPWQCADSGFQVNGQQLFLPTKKGYLKYKESVKKSIELFNVYSDKEILLNILMKKNKIYFDKDGQLTSQGIKTAQTYRKNYMKNEAEMSMKDFYDQQIIKILNTVHRPVWKIFFSLLCEGKFTYSSSAGYRVGGQDGFSISGKMYPYGVTWKENNIFYRALLTPGDIPYFLYREGQNPSTLEYQGILNGVPPLTLEDYNNLGSQVEAEGQLIATLKRVIHYKKISSKDFSDEVIEPINLGDPIVSKNHLF